MGYTGASKTLSLVLMEAGKDLLIVSTLYSELMPTQILDRMEQ